MLAHSENHVSLEITLFFAFVFAGARIKIDCDGVDLTNPMRKCVITGTSDQIANAKGLLDEKVAEDIEMRNRRGDVGTNRGRHTPRKLMAKGKIFACP